MRLSLLTSSATGIRRGLTGPFQLRYVCWEGFKADPSSDFSVRIERRGYRMTVPGPLMWPLATLGFRLCFRPGPSPEFPLTGLWSHSFARDPCCVLSLRPTPPWGTCPGRGTLRCAAPFTLSLLSCLSGEQPSQPGMALRSRLQLSACGPELLFILLRSS